MTVASAAYPNSIYSPIPSTLIDNVDLVQASHVNSLRAEVRAIEMSLGTGLLLSPTIKENAVRGVDFIANSAATWASLGERLDNMEKAALRNNDLFYVALHGGSVISPASSSSGGLGIGSPGGDTFASLEVFPSTVPEWSASSDRSSIKLWGSGKVDAKSLHLVGTPVSGTARTLLLDPSSAKIIDAGSMFSVTEDGIISAGDNVLIDPRSKSGSFRYTARIPLGMPSAGGFVVDVKTAAPITAFGVIRDSQWITTLTSTGVLTTGNVVITPDSGIQVGSLNLTSAGVTGPNFEVSSARIKTSGASLASDALSLQYAGITASNTLTKLRGTGVLKMGVPGIVRYEYPMWARLDPEFGSNIQITEADVSVYGSLKLPNNPTYIWPPDNPNGMSAWLDTPPETDGYCDLYPKNYNFLYPSIGSTVPSDTEFNIVAPACGEVKITLQAEVYGNVSRSAVSYDIRDLVTNQYVLACGPSHAVAINAPVADKAGDFFYVHGSNVYFQALIPGRPYRIRVLGQRAIPGAIDADGPYFPWHPNYGPGYPWGRWFPVRFLRVIVEPVISAVRYQV